MSDRSVLNLIDKLNKEHALDKEEWIQVIDGYTPEIAANVFEKARVWQEKYYGKQIFVRGLIEMTNYCKNDCYYCGIRRSNRNADRYRLTDEQILRCCK